MSVEIKITLSDIEYKALSMVAYDPQEWCENFAKNRCRKAIDAIAEEIVQEKLEAGETIQGTKYDLVEQTDKPTAKEASDAEEARLNNL